MGKTESNRGRSFEYRVRNYLNELGGWFAKRVILSGHITMRRYTGILDEGDIIAEYKTFKMKEKATLFIECKATKHTKIILKREWLDILEGGKNIIVMRFGREGGRPNPMYVIDVKSPITSWFGYKFIRSPWCLDSLAKKQVTINRHSVRVFRFMDDPERYYFIMSFEKWIKEYADWQGNNGKYKSQQHS